MTLLYESENIKLFKNGSKSEFLYTCFSQGSGYGGWAKKAVEELVKNSNLFENNFIEVGMIFKDDFFRSKEATGFITLLTNYWSDRDYGNYYEHTLNLEIYYEILYKAKNIIINKKHKDLKYKINSLEDFEDLKREYQGENWNLDSYLEHSGFEHILKEKEDFIDIFGQEEYDSFYSKIPQIYFNFKTYNEWFIEYEKNIITSSLNTEESSKKRKRL